MKNVLVLEFSGLGNALLSTQLIENLSSHNNVDIVTNSQVIYDLFKNCQFVRHIILSRIKISFKYLFNPVNIFDIFREILNIRHESYDIVISPFPSARNPLVIFSKAKMKIAHNYKKIDFNTHKTDIKRTHDFFQNLNLLNSLNITPARKSQNFWFTKEEINFAKNYLAKNKIKGKILGVHPGSSGGKAMKIKRWPLENFNKIIKYLTQKEKFKVLVFLGPEEKELEKHVAKNKQIFIVKNLNIRQTAALISHCNYFISNDSGLMHLASMLNIPVLAIFGSTDPTRTSPIGSHILVHSKIKCAPCQTLTRLGKPFRCVYRSPLCMKSIGFEEVLKGFRNLTSKHKSNA